MRKITFISIVTILCMIFLSACGGQSSSSGTTPSTGTTGSTTQNTNSESQQAETKADPIILKVADSFPSGHYIPEHGTKPWMEEITEKTNGRGTFEYYPSEQLGKLSDLLDLLKRGTVDIAYVPPAFNQGKMPLSQVVTLPSLFNLSVTGTKAYMELADKEPILTTDYLNNDIRHMWGAMTAPYNVATVNKPVQTLDDLQGMILKTGGGIQDQITMALGASGINIPSPETYESMERGTVNGAIFPLSSVKGYRVNEVAKYYTEGFDITVFYAPYAINEKVWQSLPEEIRTVFLEANQKYSMVIAEFTDRETATLKKQFEEEGMTFFTLPEEDKVKVKEKLDPIIQTWIEQTEAQGYKAKEVYDAFTSAIQENQ